MEPSGVGREGSTGRSRVNSWRGESVEGSEHGQTSIGARVDTDAGRWSREDITRRFISWAVQEEMSVILTRSHIATGQATRTAKVRRAALLLPRLLERRKGQIRNAHT